MGPCTQDSPDTYFSPLLPRACSASDSQGSFALWTHNMQFKWRTRKKPGEKTQKTTKPKTQQTHSTLLVSLLPTLNIPVFPATREGSCLLILCKHWNIFLFLLSYPFFPLSPPLFSRGCKGSSNPCSHLGLSAARDTFLWAAPFISHCWPGARPPPRRLRRPRCPLRAAPAMP